MQFNDTKLIIYRVLHHKESGLLGH